MGTPKQNAALKKLEDHNVARKPTPALTSTLRSPLVLRPAKTARVDSDTMHVEHSDVPPFPTASEPGAASTASDPGAVPGASATAPTGAAPALEAKLPPTYTQQDPPLPTDVSPGLMFYLASQFDKLNARLDNVATKDDISHLQGQLNHHDDRIAALEARPAAAPSSTGTPTSAKHDPSDPAHKRVEFKGFALNDAEGRLKAMSDFLSNFPNYRPTFGNEYTGPYSSKRTLKDTGYAEFVNADQKREFMDAVKAKSMTTFTYNGSSIVVKHGVSKVNKHRTYLLLKAKELLEKEEPSKEVTVHFDDRVVKVSGNVAFTQGKSDLGGCFTPKYAHLSLPN